MLPRLLAARRANDMHLAVEGCSVTAHDVDALLSHITTPDHSLAEATLAVLKLRGISREDILLELFQPVARRLGDMWRNDDCTFADVTLGVGRLQRLLRSEAMPPARRPVRAGRGSILIACLPGEQHTFGAFIIEDFFRQAGWETVTWSGAQDKTLETVARSAPFDVIGISVGNDHLLGGMKSMAQALRGVSSRHLMGIVAGGRALARDATASEYGVDAIVHDARAAVPTAASLLSVS
ncbi:MAG: cobalamin B12-binding domain-containing protein [Beijerinckiaceae bacterium]